MIPKEILKQVHRIEIQTRSLVDTLFAGEYHSAFKGRGMEFSEVREYQQGDEVRNIDWNVTARAGAPFVKVFEEERELTVMLAVDASASGDFGSGQRMKGEVAVELSALLAFAAIVNNDRVGLLIFTDEPEVFIPPKKGRRHVLRVIRELLYFQPRRRGTSLRAALEYLDRLLHRRSVVFLISDFLDQGYDRALQLVGRRHDLVAIALSDPRERQLPSVGLVSLYDAEQGPQVVVDTGSPGLRRFYAARRREEEARRAALFRQQGVDAVNIDISRSYMEPLIQFFQARLRRSR
ncbi:MAG: DUF58 domain-containing protein [Candidatus Handelsmanbacteria bacterium]|nr:DUF58 domain-containing protein [Candidatus Handelsmanbacteria bacterium]